MKYQITYNNRRFKVTAKDADSAVNAVKTVMNELEDEHLSPMTYKKLKEMGYSSDDWRDWDQQHANEIVAKGRKTEPVSESKKQEKTSETHNQSPETHNQSQQENTNKSIEAAKQRLSEPVINEDDVSKLGGVEAGWSEGTLKNLKDYISRNSYSENHTDDSGGKYTYEGKDDKGVPVGGIVSFEKGLFSSEQYTGIVVMSHIYPNGHAVYTVVHPSSPHDYNKWVTTTSVPLEDLQVTGYSEDFENYTKAHNRVLSEPWAPLEGKSEEQIKSTKVNLALDGFSDGEFAEFVQSSLGENYNPENLTIETVADLWEKWNRATHYDRDKWKWKDVYTGNRYDGSKLSYAEKAKIMIQWDEIKL